MDYNHDAIWMSRIIDTLYAKGVPNRLLANLLSVGGIPLVISVLYIRLATTPPSLGYLTAHLLLAVMLSAIGYLVWYYDERLLPAFFTQVRPLLANQTDLDEIAHKYSTFFARSYWKTLVLWVPLGPLAMLGNYAFLAQQGVGTPNQPVFWLYLAYATIASLYTGVGIHVILTTLLCVGEVSTLEFDIDPLATDGLGGMSAIGWFSVRTMGLAAIGSLGMPIAFQLVMSGSFGEIIYVAFGTYMLLLIGIFVYPTVLANRQAETLREDRLEMYKAEIDQLEQELSQQTTTTASVDERLAKQLELQRLKRKYDEYDAVKLYPLSIGVVVRFAGSILLPASFLLMELYLPRFI